MGSQRVGHYLAEWLVDVRPRLRWTTFNGYKMAVDRVTAGLGAVRMDDRTPRAIERVYAELLKTGGRRGQGLSAKSVRNTHVALRKALADAERLELIDRNPAARARPPRGERVEIVTWTSAQVAQFLRGVAGDPLFALWVQIGRAHV